MNNGKVPWLADNENTGTERICERDVVISNESKIESLLEKSLSEGLSPEQVCGDSPELLPILKHLWNRCRTVSSELDFLFPPSLHSPADRYSKVDGLPVIPGYQLYDILGKGGMGIVFRGRHLKLDRPIALKMMLPGTYAGPIERKRFEREAQIIASLSHPHIVQVFDVGDVEGSPFYTMELIDGGSLARVLNGDSRPIRESVALMIQLANAIDLVHRSGVIHRDLKPANILVTAEGVAKISDFGLAYQPAGTGITLNTAWLGTPSYMAPEQALGQTSSIGPAADIYSLGAVLYELLTGWPPFRAESAIELQRQTLHDEPLPPSRLNPAVPRDLEAICLKCLEKEPQQRYRSAGELSDDLKRFLNDVPVLARRTTIGNRIERWIQRNRAISFAMAGITTLTLLLLVGSIWSANHFRELADANGELAREKSKLARQFESERDKAINAEQSESKLREKADSLNATYQKNLYIAEMTLAAQASAVPGGLSRVHELLGQWAQMSPDLRRWEWYYLNGLCHQDLETYHWHFKAALDVAWSPDGTQLASSGADGTICIMDRTGKRPLRRLIGHRREVMSIAWNRAGTRLASASWDGLVKAWDTTSGECLLNCMANAGELYCVTWSPDGHFLAVSGKDGVIRIWDVASGQMCGELRGHTDTVAGLAWSPNGSTLASASHDFTVRMWSMIDLSEQFVLRGHVNWVNEVEWSPDGTRCGTVSNDQTLRIWNSASGAEQLRITGHTQGVRSLSWSPNGERIATASEDLSLRVWSTVDGAEILESSGHLGELTGVAWSPDGTRIASSDSAGAVKLWSSKPVEDLVVPLPPYGKLEVVAWNPVKPKRLAACWSEGVVQVWDQQQQAVTVEFRAEGTYLQSAAWHPDGKRLATGSSDGLVRIWDIDSPSTPVLQLEQRREVRFIGWDPQGKWLATAGVDRQTTIWDAVTGQRQRELTGHSESVTALCWHPQGQVLATGAKDGVVKLWNVATGEQLLSYEQQRSSVASLAWRPDGTWLASSSVSSIIHLWDTQTGELMRTLRGHTAAPSQLAWNAEGDRLASAGRDSHLKIWDVDCGREVQSLSYSRNRLSSVSWSPDGRSIATGDENQTVRIADAAIGYLSAKAPQLLPELTARIEADASPTALLLRAQVYQGMRDWSRSANDLRDYLKQTSSPWMILEPFVTSPHHIGGAHTGTSHFLSGDVQRAIVASACTPSHSSDWKQLEGSQQGVIDLAPFTEGRSETSAFVLFPVFSAVDQSALIHLGSDDDARVWVNQRVVYEHTGPRVALPDQDTIQTNFSAGWNWILIEVVNRGGDHGLYLRLSEPDHAKHNSPVSR